MKFEFGDDWKPRHTVSIGILSIIKGDWKKSGHGLLVIPHVGREAHPTAPEAGALPGTGRYRAIFQKND